MTELDERKALVMGILDSATAEIPGSSAARRSRALIECNKSKLALLILEEAGEDYAVSRSYWSHLTEAAGMLGLRQPRLDLARRHRRNPDRVV